MKLIIQWLIEWPRRVAHHLTWVAPLFARVTVGWVFLLTWFPRYLTEVHHVPVGERGTMATLPMLLGIGGMLTGGWITDRLSGVLGLRWGRCLPTALSRFVGMAAFVSCAYLPSAWSVTAALCVMAIATDLGVPAIWAFMQDIGGRHVGSVLGWSNMWGNFGAAVSPLVLNAIVGAGHWQACFWTCAAAFLISGLAALGIDSTRPLVAQE